MDEYLDLSRRFGLLTNYSAEELFASDLRGKGLRWDEVLKGRFSIIVGRANFGKTMELRAKCKALRAQGQPAVYIALQKVLSEDNPEDALEGENLEALTGWKQSGGELTVFVDSLDEASLGIDDGIRKSLRRVNKTLGWPAADVKWVLSSRPAVLTEDVLELLQAELRTTLYTGASEGSSDGFEGEQDTADAAIGDITSADAASKTQTLAPKHEHLKVYSLLPLERAGAVRYLRSHRGISQPEQTLSAAWRYGLGRLAEGPGGLDILAHIDLVQNPHRHLTEVFDRMVGAVQQQQRMDPRERRVGNPPPESLREAIERLAGASAVCQLLNIEISPKALRYRDGVLSARPIIASLLSEESLAYLLGSRLFIDSGQHQVKLYPDELLPFLAAKRLASLVKSPEHARRLLSNFTWYATTGECGVYRALLPLVGWLSVFSAHCRRELLIVEPQAVAFFGDLRNPQVQLAEASGALERTIERLVSEGDSLGRSHFTLTAENYWQAAKPGIEPTLRRLFEHYGTDRHAREALLSIASHAPSEALRDATLDAYGRDYAKLLRERTELDYILSLGRDDDYRALGAALEAEQGLAESQVSRLVQRLAWKVLDARAISRVVARQFRLGAEGFWLDWVLTHEVAEEASNVDLYGLTRSLLLQLVDTKSKPARGTGAKFIELLADLLALVVNRSADKPLRVAKLCLVLRRFVNKHRSFDVDTSKLRSALQDHQEVRLAFLRGLIHPTDKTATSIFQAVFDYPYVYSLVPGDDEKIGEPGFSELIANRKKNAAKPTPHRPTKSRRRAVVDEKSKAALRAMLDRIRDASQESALAWVAEWLVNTTSRSRYGECDFAIFENAAGSEIAQAVRAGLSNLWRKKDPTWKEAEPNSTYHITIAGLQGLHLELGDGSRLPTLSSQEIRRAIRYAQFEMNGYPRWFWSLVTAHEQIAAPEFNSILASAQKGQVSLDKAETLIRHLNEAPRGIQQSLARAAWNFILRYPRLPQYAYSAALEAVVSRTDAIDQVTFEEEAWRRMDSAFDKRLPSQGEPDADMDAEAQKAWQELEEHINELRRQRSNALVWGSVWLWNYPGTFCRRWESWRASKSRSAEDFMFALAARLGEDRGARLVQITEKGSEALNTLKVLYDWVCSVVREEDDVKREEGRTFAPGDRDHAERLRDALVPAISHAKSEQAYEILEELRQRADGRRAKYLRYTQFMMREAQYTKQPIAQADYPEFERSFAPVISDYIAFAMAVETDLLTVKSEIETGDFSLRRFFSSVNFKRIKTDNDGLALEEDFQALLGSELNHVAGGRYEVTLESILPEGTRRDVLCQANSLRATVELKMSLRWTLADYIEALEKQLQGQYMKAPNSKIGFFVVVLQKQRKWDGPDGKSIKFDELLAILRDRARKKEIADNSVFLRVIGIDATPKEDFRAAKNAIKIAGDGARGKYADGEGNTWSGRGRKPKWIKAALESGKSIDDFLAAKHEKS
ncbi:H-NS histone family protein [Bradyrhizobium diazoefficiens]|nr:H-NS histone family protein [Bradyrhizobium diazoefficiens]MBR0775824.1 H-NS histone family protein [Bradyrhizobium diazoefficiens]